MSTESEFTRKKISKFLCQELLYEFVTHNLESHREKEVTDFLVTCRETQRELDNLNKGLRYTDLASQIRVAPGLVEALDKFETPWIKRFRSLSLWSSQTGWRILPYAVFVLAVGLGLVVFKPWIKREPEEVVLAKKEAQIIAKEPDAAEPVAQPQPVALPPPSPLPPPASPSVPGLAQTQQSRLQVQPAPETTPKESVQESKESKVATRGLLYRTPTLYIRDFQNSWPLIRDKIVALGGKAAGNVELGWLKKQDEAYFHFSLPESNLKEFQVFLSTFGPVQFTGEPHPRVMPEGQIRIILTLKDGITQDESAPTSP